MGGSSYSTQRAPELVHVDDARRWLGAEPWARDVPRSGVAHRVAAAPYTEFSADRGQRENRHRRIAAIAVALEAPAATNHRRRCARVIVCQLPERRFGHAGDLCRALEGPRRRSRAQLFGALRVLGEKPRVGESFLEQVTMDRQRDGHIGAGPGRQVEIGLPRERCRTRVDDDEPRARFLRLAHVRHEMDARCGGVDAPEDDEPCFRIVLVGDRRHLAVERLCGHAGRRRAHGTREARGAEPAEEHGVEGVLREQAIRSAVGKRQDGFAAPAVAHLEHACGDELDRFVPLDAPEAPQPFRSGSHGGVLQPRIAVHAIAELPDFRADVAGGRRVQRRAVDFDDPPFADGDGQTARVGAVERARGVDNGVLHFMSA